MTGITELDKLLKSMHPTLLTPEFVFCTVSDALDEYISLAPVSTFIYRTRRLNAGVG